MTEYTFKFEMPLELSAYEALNKTLNSLPDGLHPSFVSFEECKIWSNLDSATVERKMRPVLRQYTGLTTFSLAN